VALLLQKKGFKVIVVKGGHQAWIDAGYPLES
jgi:rhodanese-related sulfurtransferase